MRRLFALLAALSVAACAPPRPREAAPAGAPGVVRSKVTVYSPHGREMLEPFERMFEAAHPAYDMEWLDIGSQECLDRLRAERANPGADVWWGAPHTMFEQAAEAGLLAPYEPAWSDQIDAGKRDPEHRWYGQYLTPGVIVYNTELVTAEEAPRDWDELLDPKWADRILIRDPLSSGTMRTFIQAMIARQADEEAGWAWLLKLDAQTKSYPANPALMWAALSRGEGSITVWNLRDVEIQKREHGYRLAYVIPASGCPVVTDAIALVAGGPNPDGARAFFDYATGEEATLWAARERYCIPARHDIDPAALPADLPRDIPELDLPWDQMRAEGDRQMEHWDQWIKNQG